MTLAFVALFALASDEPPAFEGVGPVLYVYANASDTKVGIQKSCVCICEFVRLNVCRKAEFSVQITLRKEYKRRRDHSVY